jgi:hypothetical protein
MDRLWAGIGVCGGVRLGSNASEVELEVRPGGLGHSRDVLEQEIESRSSGSDREPETSSVSERAGRRSERE